MKPLNVTAWVAAVWLLWSGLAPGNLRAAPCTLPPVGEWVVDQSCSVEVSRYAPESVRLTNGALVTVANAAQLGIDVGQSLVLESGAITLLDGGQIVMAEDAARRDPERVHHFAGRSAFGDSADLARQIASMGIHQYLRQQLDGTLNDDDNLRLQALLAYYESLFPGQAVTTDIGYLIFYQYARGLLSNAPLREVMTEFWERHLNTYWVTLAQAFARAVATPAEAQQLATTYEAMENAAFRDNALEMFHDLLLTSATGLPMLVYLDNISNSKIRPNENYARELLELHTMGADNGYLQADVEAVARCFTGWRVCKKAAGDVGDPHAPCVYDPVGPVGDPLAGIWAFHFDPQMHDYSGKTIFSGTAYELFIPGQDPFTHPELGLEDGMAVLTHLAEDNPKTAERMAAKLVREFVSDSAPPQALIDRCADRWRDTRGNIGEVMAVLLTSDEFLGQADYRGHLIRTPFEYLVAHGKVWDDPAMAVEATAYVVYLMIVQADYLNSLPFFWPTPDGFPSFGADQFGAQKTLGQVRFNVSLFDPDGGPPIYKFRQKLTDAGVAADAQQIADFFLTRLYHNGYTSADRQQAVDYLLSDVNGDPLPLDPQAPDFDARLRQLAVFCASYPQSMRQ